MEFNNASGLEFFDISTETQRVYVFNNGFEYRITQPLKLNVSKAGGHRVFDASGRSHYIPKGWAALYWNSREGRPHFVK